MKQNQDNIIFNVEEVIGQTKNKSSQREKSSFSEIKKLDDLCTPKMQLQKIGDSRCLQNTK